MSSVNNFFCCDKQTTEVFTHFENICFPNFFELQSADTIFYIGNHIYKTKCVVTEISEVIKRARTKWFQIQGIVLDSSLSVCYKEMISGRDFINKSFEALLKCLQICDGVTKKETYIAETIKYLNTFSQCVIPITKLENEAILKISSPLMNNMHSPVYHYFHTYLDIQYYLIVLGHICGTDENILEVKLESVMRDFVVLSKTRFKRSTDKNNNIYICNCMKTFWLLIQLFTERFSSRTEFFWDMFNRIVEVEKPSFVLWLLKDIAYLQSLDIFLQNEGNDCVRIRPNYNLLESKLKEILLEANSNTLVEAFKLIEPIICDLWLRNGKIEIYQILWDFYSKRLNVSNRKCPIESINALKLSELIDTILYCPKSCTEDFELFVGMLLCHLKEYPSHWNKIKGRIYSQLGPNKVRDLSSTGIMHVMILFMALASVNFEELMKKILSFLNNLPEEKRNSTLVWNLYATLILRHVKEGHDIEKLGENMLQLLQDASSNQKSFHLIRDFVQNFDYIIMNSLNMQLHQSVLINTWLGKYMLHCYFQDLNKTLEVILNLLEKVNNDSWVHWEPSFKEYIYPNLKQLTKSSSPTPLVGKLAGKISILIPTLTSESFTYFNADTVSPKISLEFLKEVFEDDFNIFIISSQQEVIVQSWIKICFLTQDTQNELTNNVKKLDVFPSGISSYLENSKDPIYSLIDYLGSDLKQHTQSPTITKFCELCFGQADRFISHYLTQPQNEIIVSRIYTYISLAFINCGSLLYNPNKSSSPLTRLVQTLILPMDFLIGKKIPHNFILSAIKKTWHLFFEAIVKLNVATDSFLERTLRDMIVKYMPYFSTMDSPIMKCLGNEVTASAVLEKIFVSYLKHPVKESDANMLKALKIISDFVLSTTSVNLLRMLVNKTLYGLFEIVIYHSQRSSAISVIKIITSSQLYTQIKQDFANAVISISERNLAFNTINYFQLMNILAKLIPSDIRNLMGNIRQQISSVERMRGVGFDKTLRMYLEKLEITLDMAR